MQARCKLDARWPGTSTTISTYFFSGEVGIERQGCLASLLGQPPALLLLLFLVCLVFSLCIPPSPRVSRRGYPEVYRRTETEAVKAAARPAAASVSLHHARDLVLPRASSISGVASPPPPFHSPSRWPLLVPSVESGGLRESLETTRCLADPRPLTSNSLTRATLPLLLPRCDTSSWCNLSEGFGRGSKFFFERKWFFWLSLFLCFPRFDRIGDDAWFSIIFQEEEEGYFSSIRDYFARGWAGYGFEVLLGAALNLYGEVERKHDREINLFVTFPMKTFSTVGGTWHKPWPWRIARSPSSKGTKV